MSLFFLSIPPKKLSQSITSASSTFRLNNIKSWKRTSLGVLIDLAQSDFGTRAFGCFRNDTGTKIEIFEFDPATIASTNITILKRGLDFNGDLSTETTAYKLDWSANETTVQLGTDIPQLFEYLKEYIDAASIAGAVPASTTAAGIVEEATQAEAIANTVTGGTGSKLFVPLDKMIDSIRSNIKVTTASTSTLSITTDGSQKVIVFAKGLVISTGDFIVTLAYNGVSKDVNSTSNNNTSFAISFSLMYTEVPAAGTHNITVTTNNGSLSSVVIIAIAI